jgi:hypothetical protein
MENLILFHCITSFHFFITKISSLSGPMYAINSWFYVYNFFDVRIECYDINGKSVDKENVHEEKSRNYSFGYFNNKFIIANIQKKN